MINIKDYKSILCLNGYLPPASFFQVDLPIIAADGAANTLMQMNITPQLVIGDLDSIHPTLIEKLKTFLHYDQDQCDYQKALLYLEKHQLLPTIVVGVNGGYLDHILNNVNHFIGTDSVLYAPPLYGFTLRAREKKSFSLRLHTKISIIGIPHALVSSKGLQWELDHFHMTFPGKNSCFNRTNQDDIELEVHEGSALVLIEESFLSC